MRLVKRLALLPALAAALVLAGVAAARPTPAERAQREHAHRVLAEIQALDARMEHVVQAWDGATVRLAATRRSVRSNRTLLTQARRELAVARLRLERRLVGIYEHGTPTAADVVLGATSLSDIEAQTEAARAVAREDALVAREAGAATHRFRRRARALAQADAEQRATVDQLASARARIESGLAERRRLLASIRTQIARIEAQQRAEERRLAIEARARIAREQQQLAAERARAARSATAPRAEDPVAPAAASPVPTGPAPLPGPGAPAAPSVGALPPPQPEAAAIAARYLGVPYVWGGATPAGFDCSGLVMYVYAQLGISLPHYTVSQWNATTPVAMSEIQPGDLLFFDGLGHVGIYIGGGQFIHAPHTGDVVRVSVLGGWYADHLDGARRV